MNVIELRDVELRHEALATLAGVNLSVSPGDRLVVIGPSGAGKTSLLRVMSGLVRPSRGEVLRGGRPINSIPPAHRSIGMLSQDYALYPQLTVRSNLEVALKPLKLSVAEVGRRIDQVVEWFEIGDILQRLPSQISGGQSQRAAFAKAIVRSPDLLLLDEPLSQLNSQLREQLAEVVLEVCRETGSTLCWVAHDPWEAFRVATRVVVMDMGRIIQIDLPQSVYNRPITRMVADLCSQWPINWIPLNHPQFDFLRPKAPRNTAIAGIRPEDWIIATDGIREDVLRPESLSPGLALKIEESCFMGFTWMSWGHIGSVRVQVQDRLGTLSTGSMVTVRIPTNKIIWVEQ